MKKLLSISLALTMIILCGQNALAINNDMLWEDTTIDSETVNVSCEEYPEAYIEINSPKNQNTRQISVLGRTIMTATVYVEENYAIADDEEICVSSRLLTEDEVNAIGKENFNNFVCEPTANVPHQSTSRGKLTISLEVAPNVSTQYAKQYTLIGIAKWSGLVSHLNPSNTPAAGEDYAGFMWGGGYDFSNQTSQAVDNFGVSRTVYDADVDANTAYVWSAQEGALDREEDDYLKNWRSDLTLEKVVLTGNGNTTSISYKYIHTYTTVAGSLNVSTGSGGVSSSFSLSGVDHQWSLILTHSEIPY